MAMKQSDLLLQQNFLVCKLIITYPDNNISSVCTHKCCSICFAVVAVTGLMTTDTLYFHFTMSFWVSFRGSGAIFWAARTLLLLKENHYGIGLFEEKSYVGNYVSDSLHITLAMITHSHCRQQTNLEICSVNGGVGS